MELVARIAHPGTSVREERPPEHTWAAAAGQPRGRVCPRSEHPGSLPPALAERPVPSGVALASEEHAAGELAVAARAAGLLIAGLRCRRERQVDDETDLGLSIPKPRG
jgi:hypothetical protein